MQQHNELKAYEGEVDEFLTCTSDGIGGQLYASATVFSLTQSYRSLYGAQSGWISPKNSIDTFKLKTTNFVP